MAHKFWQVRIVVDEGKLLRIEHSSASSLECILPTSVQENHCRGFSSDLLYVLMQVRFLTQSEISPAQSLATDQYFLQTIGRTRTPILRLYTYPGDVVLLGRYHAINSFAENTTISMTRRLTGGRIFPSGHGFVQFSLILPHRSALFSDDPYHLAPFQVLNRYVRGVLHGLKTNGVEAFYPGRDFLTIRRLPAGWISFVTDDNGALVFEGGLFVQRDMSLLPHLLDRVDPHGTLPCQLFMPDQIANLEKAGGKTISTPQVIDLLRRGFAQQFGQFSLELNDQDLNAAEQKAIEALTQKKSAESWREERAVRSDLSCFATTATPLGQLQIRFSVTPENAIGEVQFSGDCIANPAGLSALEYNLQKCPLEKEALWQVIDHTFLQPEHYLLGVGKLETLPDVILKGTADQ